MQLYNFLFYVLLISFVCCLPVNRPRRLLIKQLLLGPIGTQQDTSNGWKTTNYLYKQPQVEIQVLKGHISPDQNWIWTNEYKYSNQYYESIRPTTKVPPTIDHKETKELDLKNRVDAQKNNQIPSIGFRNIIDPPVFCQEGYELDKNDVCRERIER